MMAVLPSAERQTEEYPWTSILNCWVQTPPFLIQTHALPPPPTSAVSPLADRDTEMPCCLTPTVSEATSLFPCCVQTSPCLVQIQTAPTSLLSCGPPIMAVLPSAESATESPCCESNPPAPEPTSPGPCWVQPPPALF